MVYLGCGLLFLAVAAPASPGEGPSKAQRKVIVGVPQSFPPYYQLDKDGNPSGFAVDVMNEVAKRAGLRVAYRVEKNWVEIFKALRAGDIDIVPSLGISDTRKRYIAFTQPVDTFRIVLFVRDDTQDVTGIDDMVGRPVAVVTTTAARRILESRDHIQLRVFDNFTEALFALLSAGVDAFAYPEPVTWKLAREARVDKQIKVVGEPIFEIKRAMAVRKDNVELLAVLDHAVRDFVASPEYRDIYVAWFGKPVAFWTLRRVVLAAGFLFGLSLIIMAWWRDRSIVRLNRALQKAEARFKAVVDYSPAKIHIKDVEGRYTLINKEAERLFGVTDEEGRGKTSYDLFSKNVADGFMTHDKMVIESGKAVEEEEKFELEDGVHTFLTVKFPIYDLNGVAAVGAIGTDITERKQAEEALKASEARLTEIFAIAPEAVIAVNRDMNIQLFNQGAERIFGYKADDVLGRSLDMLMPEYHRKDHRKHVEGFDSSGDTYRLMDKRQEIVGLRKDGTEFPASASVSKLELGGEKIFTVMLRDITDSKQAQDALLAAKGEAETANRTKSEFLAAMSHDLRTPLNAILGFADILSHQYFGPIDDKYREYAEDIHSSGEHLLELVNDILDLSTIEAGKQALVREKLAIEEVIAECAKIISEKARFYGIDLITKVPKNLPSLYADRRATKQILLNLLSNAVKFTPEGGKVTLSAKGLKGKTVFMVADSGKGIPAEELPGLTDPFTRGERDPYVAEKGWGLGLTITKSLVDLHDGTLDIKSKVGKGTTVTVTLPNEAP